MTLTIRKNFTVENFPNYGISEAGIQDGGQDQCYITFSVTESMLKWINISFFIGCTPLSLLQFSQPLLSALTYEIIID